MQHDLYGMTLPLFKRILCAAEEFVGDDRHAREADAQP
jgi:hypothetical protein